MPETTLPRRPLAGLLTAQFFGAFNDNAMKLMVALLAGAVAVRGITDPAAKELALQEQTTIAFVVFTLPLMLFSLPSALMADRFSKRTLTIAMKVLEFVLMSAGAVVLYFDPTGGNALFVVLGFMGLQSAIFSPAKYGIMPQLCDEATITKGNGLLELWTFVAIIGGYGVGGALLESTRPDVYLAMGVLALFAIVGLSASFAIPRVPAIGSPGSKPIRDAWKAIRADRTLQLVIAGQTVFWGLASLLGQDVLTYAKSALELGDFDAGITFVAFGIGVGAGSVLAGRLSPTHIEPGLIPFGAIGLALGTTALGVFAPGYAWTLAMMGFIGVSAGITVVPLEAMLQWYAPVDKRGAVIAIANVPIFFGVMLGSFLVYGLSVFGGFSAAEILTIAGLMTVVATAWAMWLLPKAFVGMVFLFLTNTLYRLRVEGRKNLPEEGGALIVVNHVSLIDWLFVIASSERPIRFLVDSTYFHHWFLRPFMKVLGAIPISAASPRELMRAMKDAGRLLKNGELVCIFAEGEISRTGALLPFRRGLTRILKGNDVPVIPAHLDQVWGSPFSSKGGGFLRSWNGPIPRPVTLSFGEPMPATATPEEIRTQIKILDERAWGMRQESRPPLHHTLTRTCRRRRFTMAACDTTGKRVSRISLLAGSLLLARKLREAWGDQETVGIMLPTSVGSAMVNFAAAFSGRVSVNLNYTVGRSGLESAVRQAELRTVITSREFIEKAEIELPSNVQPIYLDEVIATVSSGERRGAFLRAMFFPVRALERFAGAIRRPEIGDVVTVIFSSGSTGEPKGIVLTHSNIDSNSEAISQVISVEKNERLLGILPQFHSFGYMGMWFAANNGIGTVCHSNPVDAATIGPLVKRERVTLMIATPTFLQVYLRRCSPGQFGSLRLVLTGAEKLSSAAADAFEDIFGLRPFEGYGTTECSPAVAIGTAPYRAPGFFQAGSKRGSIGQPLPGVAVCIVDPDTFDPLTTGEPGMLLVRGPNVMKGYLGQPELTARVMHDGWYITGDIATIDEDGYIRITDRLSRFSKIGGEMVPHGNVEEALHQAAGEADRQIFSVVGLPDPRKGERLSVVHTLDESDLPAILEALRETGLPNLFIPREDQFVRVDEIPILGTGKVDLKGVKKLAGG